VILDKALSQKNVHLFAEKVVESILGFSLEKVRVFYGSMPVLHLERLSLGAYPFGLEALGTCEGGSVLARLSTSLSLSFKNFTCSEFIKRAEVCRREL